MLEQVTFDIEISIQDIRSKGIKALPTDKSDQSVLLEKVITIIEDPVELGAQTVRGSLRRARVFRD